MPEVLKAAKKALEAVFVKVMIMIIIELISPSYMIVAYLIKKKKKKEKDAIMATFRQERLTNLFRE